MAGYSTQKRDTQIRLFASRANGGAQVDDPNYGRLPSDQETYSFRTNKLDVDPDSDHLDTRVTYNPFTENPSQFDTGHEFYTRRRTSRLSHMNYFARNSTGSVRFRGPLVLGSFAENVTDNFPVVNRLDANSIKYYGSRAISRTIPTLPSANVSTFIGELISDGLPITGAAIGRLFEQAKYLQSIGDATLILKFALEPFIRDISKVLIAVSTAGRRIDQFMRDSGRQVRRSYHFEDENSSVVEAISLYETASLLQPLMVARNPDMGSKTTVTNTKTWFSGAFMYYAEFGSSILEQIREAGRKADLILGFGITPETLWELTPWSWLVDWKANIGDAISNMTRFQADRLVLRYGYLMRQTVVSRNYALNGLQFINGAPGTLNYTLQVVQKERFKATPYGFGLNPNSFTVDQWAILAALGLSKGGKVLP